MYRIRDIPTHNTAPAGTVLVELDNPAGGSEYATLSEVFASVVSGFVPYQRYAGTNSLANAAYTLVLTDAFKELTMTPTTARQITIPLNSSVAFPIGTFIYFTNTSSSFTIGMTPAGGVTLRGGGNASVGPNSGHILWKIGTDTWLFF